MTIVAGACGPGAAGRPVPLLGDGHVAPEIVNLGPATFGAAPGNETSLWSKDSVLVVADARIDDKASLLRRLDLTRTKLPDAAIIAHAWARWGEDAPNELHGDYAFALFDRRTEALWLVRDALGFRPLAFATREQTNIFCSLPSRLAGDSDISMLAAGRANAAQTTPLTWFKDVEQVQPGERVRLRSNGAARRFWWQPSTAPSFGGTRKDFQREMRTALEAAVSDRTVGATRVATHLSAGLDSMAVTVTAAALLRPEALIHAITARPTSNVVLTAPPGRLIDETGHAARVAERYPNIRQIVVDASGRSIAEAVAGAAARFDQPLVNPANFGWIDASCDAALAAGADRLLIAQMGNSGLSAVAADYWGQLLRREGVARFFTEWRQSARRRSPLGELRRRLGSPAPTRSEMWLAVVRSLDPGLMLKGFARRGLLVLDPTADRRIIELALTVPQNLLVRNGDQRWVAREMLRGRVPDDILDEPRRGFQSADWLGRLRAETGELSGMLGRASKISGLRFDESRTLLRTIEAGIKGELDASAKGPLACDLAIAGFVIARARQSATVGIATPVPASSPLATPSRFSSLLRLALLAEAAAFHAYASLVAGRKPGQYLAEEPQLAARAGRASPAELIAATTRISRFWPARSVCLQRALILYWMLRRRGFDARFHYGIAPVSRGFSAHSWTSLDGKILIGAEGHEQFREITRGAA